MSRIALVLGFVAFSLVSVQTMAQAPTADAGPQAPPPEGGSQAPGRRAPPIPTPEPNAEVNPSATQSVGDANVAPNLNAQGSATANPDGWRFKWHNNKWWYWLPANRWVYWSNDRWVDYVAVAPAPQIQTYASPAPVYRYSPNYSYGSTYGSNFGYGSNYRYGYPGYGGFGPNYGYSRGGVSIGIGQPYRYGTGYRGAPGYGIGSPGYGRGYGGVQFGSGGRGGVNIGGGGRGGFSGSFSF